MRGAVTMLAAVLALASTRTQAQAAADAWIVKAGRAVPVAGAPIDGAAVRIEGARIAAIGPKIDEAGVVAGHVVEIAGGIIYPGLIDAGSYQGIRRERDDSIAAFLPAHRIADAFDPLHPGFAKNLDAGITTVHLVPGNAAVLGGRTAVVKVGRDGVHRVLEPFAGLKLSLVESEYPQGRPPTSLIGAVDALRDGEGDAAGALGELRASGKPAFIAASGNREVQVAARLGADLDLETILLGDMAAARFAADLAGRVSGVILDSLPFDRPPFEWKQLADLAAGDMPLAFATRAPIGNPARLRLNAAIWVRRGLPAERVLRALTLDAARILGVDRSVGSLEAGKDADLIVLSAPIEDPRARLLLCVQDGKVVYRPGKEASHE